MTTALEVGEWAAARPSRILPPGKTWYPLYRKLGGPQGRSGREEILVPTGIRSSDRPARSQVDCATRPTYMHVVMNITDDDVFINDSVLG